MHLFSDRAVHVCLEHLEGGLMCFLCQGSIFVCEIRSDADILCAVVIGSVLISVPILRAPFWWAWDVSSPGRRVPGDVHQSPGDRQD